MKIKRFTSYALLIGASLILFALPSCKKPHSDIGAVVFKETRNKIFKDIETDVFIERFKETFEKQKNTYRNPKFLDALYQSNDFEPLILMRDLPQDRLKKAVLVLNDATAHGLNPETFQSARLNELLAKIYKKKAIKTLDEAYQVLIDFELTAANAFTNYSNALQFGMISPRKIYAQYYTATKRPDSLSFMSVFATKDITSFLDSIQPKDSQYLLLQKALKTNVQVPGMSSEESQRILSVNLERLRWKNKPSEEKYVWVNIPDFRLDVIENGKSVLNMKVHNP
jgi:murein L,D-transpeptidase YcbB/YkuD